jgi:hypothetical protein
MSKSGSPSKLRRRAWGGCRRCGKRYPAWNLTGQCAACYQAGRGGGPGPCRQCGADVQRRRRALCNRCYMYWWHTGQDRPFLLPRQRQWPCINPVCDAITRPYYRRRGRCWACSQYWYAHGTERPLRLVARLAWRKAQQEEQAG